MTGSSHLWASSVPSVSLSRSLSDYTTSHPCVKKPGS